jgi:hypothetical protein
VKILYTGMSARECGDAKRDAIRWNMDQPLLDAARRIGTLEQRRVSVGEDLSGYDLIIGVLNQALSFNTRHGVLGMLWVAQQDDTPVLLYESDWQMSSQMSHLRTLGTHPWYLNKTIGKGTDAARLYHKEDDETCDLYHDQLMYGAQRLRDPWPLHWAGILPAFAWGDHSQFTEALPATAEQLTCVDYSPYAFDGKILPELSSDRNRQWICAALSPQDKWVNKQGIEWPVMYLGSRKLKAERVTEQEVLDRTSQNWGTLSPRYTRLMGSGWWRIRYNYTAATGSVILGDPAEAGVLGPAFQQTAEQIEQLGDYELWELGRQQQIAIYQHYWSREHADQTISDAMKRAAR